jgi:hypothetical protein
MRLILKNKDNLQVKSRKLPGIALADITLHTKESISML